MYFRASEKELVPFCPNLRLSLYSDTLLCEIRQCLFKAWGLLHGVTKLHENCCQYLRNCATDIFLTFLSRCFELFLLNTNVTVNVDLPSLLIKATLFMLMFVLDNGTQ